MKKLSFTILLLALTVGVNAQVVSMIANAIKKAVPIYTPGVITYKDGHEVEYMWVELPNSGDVSIKVSNDAKHKKAEEIDATDIYYITYWTEQFPEQKLRLYRLHADKSKIPFAGTLPQDVWGYPIAASEWGVVFKCNPRYEISKKLGEIMLCYDVRAVQMGNTVTYEQVPAHCYLLCKDFENAQLIGGSREGKTTMIWAAIKMKHIAPIFASNPSIEQRINDKKLRGEDIQYILDEMAISHGLNKAVEVAPATEEEPQSGMVTNGTIGDDE